MKNLLLLLTALSLCSCLRTNTSSDTAKTVITESQRQEYHDGVVVTLLTHTQTVSDENTNVQTNRTLTVPPIVKSGFTALTGGVLGMGGVGDLVTLGLTLFAGKKAVDKVREPRPLPRRRAKNNTAVKKREDEIEETLT